MPVSPGLSTTTGDATALYTQQRVQLDQLRRDRQQIEAVLERGRAGAITVDAFQTIPSVNLAPQLKQALSDLTIREAEMSALLQRYTPDHPMVKSTQQTIDHLRNQAIPQYAQALIDQLRYQESDLEGRLRQSATELAAVPTVTITETRLTRDLQAADELFKMLNGRLEEAKLSELSAIPDVRVLDWAVAPQKPASNSAPKIILMALGASVGLAVGLALLLDQLDKRFRYPEQVSSELGLPILGAIPAIKKTRRGELAADQAAQVVEAFRTVRLNLAHSYGAAGPVTLTISSAGAGDGKSLVSSNLAVSFSEAGYRTLLIDGDIRRGEIHGILGVDRRPGLLDYLTGEAPLDDIIRPTSQRGLSVIPCGTRRHQGPGLLGSAAMAESDGRDEGPLRRGDRRQPATRGRHRPVRAGHGHRPHGDGLPLRRDRPTDGRGEAPAAGPAAGAGTRGGVERDSGGRGVPVLLVPVRLLVRRGTGAAAGGGPVQRGDQRRGVGGGRQPAAGAGAGAKARIRSAPSAACSWRRAEVACSSISTASTLDSAKFGTAQ